MRHFDSFRGPTTTEEKFLIERLGFDEETRGEGSKGVSIQLLKRIVGNEKIQF